MIAMVRRSVKIYRRIMSKRTGKKPFLLLILAAGAVFQMFSLQFKAVKGIPEATAKDNANRNRDVASKDVCVSEKQEESNKVLFIGCSGFF